MHGFGLLAVAMMLTLAGPARATSDGGHLPRLLAFGGNGERWAILALESVQEPCGVADCTVVAVDLGAKRYHERWSWSVGSKDGEVSADQLAEEFVQSLGGEGSPLRPLVSVAGRGEELPGPSPRIEGRALAVIDIEAIDSMRSYDDASQQPCRDWHSREHCSSCAEAEVEVNGRVAKVWRCRKERGAFVGSGLACDCHAPGRVVEVGTKGLARRRILLEPWMMAQNMMNGPGSEPTTAVTIAPNEWRAVRNARGDLLLLGGVVNAPMANGTWFPVVAYRSSAVDEAPEPAKGEWMGEPAIGIVVEPPTVVPTTQPTPGCAGCTASAHRPTPPWAATMAVVWLARRRRYCSSRKR
jgi:hypothetical protein